MWTALGLYTLGPKRRNKRSRTWKRKNIEDRSVIIPEETFLSDPLYLPALKEIRIQEEAENQCDAEAANNSVSHESEYKQYAKFKYSMGGNLQLYDEHIALSSPKRKIQKSYYSPKRLNDHLEFSPPARSVEYTESLDLESIDMSSPKLQPKEDIDLNDSVANNGRNAGECGGNTSELRDSLEDLKISARDAMEIPLSETPHIKTVSEVTGSGKIGNNSFGRGRTDGVRQRENVQISRTERRSGSRDRDYSPIRSEAEIVKEAKEPLGTLLGIHSQSDKTCALERDKEGVVPEKRGSKEDDSWNKKCTEVEDAQGKMRGFYNEDCNNYDRTLSYVNRQRKTIQTGDYPAELDFDMSDLSSDVFTDSEVPMSAPLSLEALEDDPGNTRFYPDSPTSEYIFSKTPCSSRKNSVESLLSGVDSLSDMDFTQEITQALSETVDEEPKRPCNGVLLTGTKGSTSNTRKPNAKNVKTTVDSVTRNSSANPRDEPLESLDDRTAKAKVNSFQNIHHVPGGGKTKIFSQKITRLKNVEPRTDTHGIESYSHLPSEFQEIARRLAKQDKQLRTNNSSCSGRCRSGKLSVSSGNLSASTTSLASAGSTKRATRPSTSRTPSIRSRPNTPSLSRSHPATYVTPYDSRSRPSSRPSSRPGSRSSSPNSRSRNTSPVRGSRSRGSSPVGSHRGAPISSRPKSGTSHSHFGSRTARTTGVSDVHHLNSPRSVFQVVPAMKK